MPVRVYSLGRPTDVLLALADRRLRAPLRAQLIEDGYDVTAVETWDEAELLLRTRALKPRLVLVDVQDEQNPAAALPTFLRLAGKTPVMVLTAASTMVADEVRALGVGHVLARPFRIGDIEKKIGELLAR